MNTTNVISVLVGVAVAILLIVRQLRAQPVSANYRLPFILGIIGLVELTGYFHQGRPGTAGIVGLAGSLVLAAVFGGLRAITTRLWVQDGVPWRQGNWITAVLWLVTLAAHFAFDEIVDRRTHNGDLASSSVLLYLAVTYTVQRLILQARAQRIGPGGGRPGPLTIFGQQERKNS